jgi:hypothetical protein
MLFITQRCVKKGGGEKKADVRAQTNLNLEINYGYKKEKNALHRYRHCISVGIGRGKKRKARHKVERKKKKRSEKKKKKKKKKLSSACRLTFCLHHPTSCHHHHPHPHQSTVSPILQFNARPRREEGARARKDGRNGAEVEHAVKAVTRSSGEKKKKTFFCPTVTGKQYGVHRKGATKAASRFSP